MNKPFRCSCGLSTREPINVRGQLMCAVCAEEIAPHEVNRKAKRDWETWQRGSLKSRHAGGPGWSRREG